MIAKIGKGNQVGGLLRYLYGPGRSNEHTNPHLIASWDDGPTALEPPVRDDGGRDFRRLTDVLNQPVTLLKKPPDKTVWHCSLRAAPDDPRLTDGQWGDIVRQVVTRTGLDPTDEDDGCRWVAVRHADDHVHLVVTLARQDGRRPSLSNDYLKVGQACRWAEDHYGLTTTAPRDRTAAPRPARAETEKARRTGRREPPRTALRRAVSKAAASATGPDDFLSKLADAGLLVRPRMSSTTPGEVTGYAVALPGDRNPAGDPVWFGGGKLAADLTWPKLLQRWQVGPPAPGTSTPERQRAWDDATRAARTGAERLAIPAPPTDCEDDAAHATGALLTVAATVVEGRRGGPLTNAADEFDRATRLPFGRVPPRTTPGTTLRTAARALAGLGRASGDELAQVLALVLALAALAEAVAHLRAAQHRLAQAQASRQAAVHLRAYAADHQLVSLAGPTPVRHHTTTLTPTRRPR